MADRQDCREAAGAGGLGAWERLFDKSSPLTAIQLLDSRFSWGPWNKVSFSRRNMHIKPPVPEFLNSPPLPLLNPRKSPTVPIALPQAKWDRATVKQVRLSGSRYSLHPLRISQGLLGTKEQNCETQLWTTGRLLGPPSKEPWQGPCLKPKESDSRSGQQGPAEMEAVQ